METITILLVEDDPQDVVLVRELLGSEPGFDFSLKVADCLSTGVAMAGSQSCDLVLLDAGLPDSQGPETLALFRKSVPDTPVVILTGRTDEEFGVKMVQMGAQDYLVKGQFTHQNLVRAIRFAIERRQLWKAFEARQQSSREDQEMRFLAQIRSVCLQTASQRLMGQADLRTSLPEAFEALMAEYATLLDRTLEAHLYKVAHPLPETTRKIARNLGFLRAGPKDVIDLHSRVIGQAMETMTPERSSVYYSEARIVLIELLGFLVSYYRTYALGSMGNMDHCPDL